MENLIEFIQKQHKEKVSNPPSVDVYNARRDETEEIISELGQKAAPDYKDWDRTSSAAKCIKHNVKLFGKQGIQISSSVGVEGEDLAVFMASKNQQDIQLFSTGSTYKMIYNTPTGYRIKREVDLQSAPGMVKIGDKLLPIKDFIESLKDVQGPPTYAELPFLPMELSKSMMEYSKRPGDIMLRKSQDFRSLVVTSYSGMDVIETKFAPGTNGKFLVFGEELTIQEIIDKFKKA